MPTVRAPQEDGTANSMTRPRILDLFCCAGGAAVGYHRAGFDITGVDLADQPEYPFEFHQADALTYLQQHGHLFDAIHASPPCQASSGPTKGTNRERRAHLHTDLIAPTRAALAAVGRPSVIENVVGAKLRPDVTLCGEMFGLPVIRHRLFELDGWAAEQPPHPRHRGRVRGWRHGIYYDGPYLAVYGDGGGKADLAECQAALQISHITDRARLVEAIPPAYTQWLGGRLIQQLEAVAS
jgi:DNA (cytosine-5)-methyltransferase 1